MNLCWLTMRGVLLPGLGGEKFTCEDFVKHVSQRVSLRNASSGHWFKPSSRVLLYIEQALGYARFCPVSKILDIHFSYQLMFGFHKTWGRIEIDIMRVMAQESDEIWPLFWPQLSGQWFRFWHLTWFSRFWCAFEQAVSLQRLKSSYIGASRKLTFK